MKKSILSVVAMMFLACLPLLLANKTDAASSVAWTTGPTPITSVDDIDLSWDLVHAGSWGTDEDLTVTVGAEEIVFVPRTVGQAGNPVDLSANRADPVTDSFIGDTGAANFNAVLDSFAYGGSNPNVLVFNDLTPGLTYRVQLFVSDERGGALSDRTQLFSDSDSLGEGSETDIFARGPASFVIGEFTADATYQMFYIHGIEQDGNALNAYVLSVEDPDLETPGLSSFYVCPDHGDDARAGTDRDQPLLTIEAALERVGGGDTIVLLPGTFYVDTMRISDIPGATINNRLTIRAETPGTATISQAWPEAAKGELEWTHEGDDIYSAPQREVDGELIYSPIGGFREDWILVGHEDLENFRNGVSRYGRGGETRDEPFRIPEHGFAHEDGRIYLRLPDRSDPNGQRVVIGFGHFSENSDLRDRAMLRVDNVPGLVIDGLRIEGAFLGMWFESAASGPNTGHNIVRNCLFEWTQRGINNRSHASIYEWNDFSYTGLRQWIDEARGLNNNRFATPEIFAVGYGPIWMFGMFIYGDRGNAEIRYNYIHQVWDGLHFGNMNDTHVYGNILEDNIDNAIEIEAGRESSRTGHNVHFYHNLVLGLANGAVSQTKGGPNVGPHYIYRNVFIGHDDPGWFSWVFAKNRSHNRSKGLIYHHNLIWMRSSSGLYWGSGYWREQEFHRSMDWRNNVMIFDRLNHEETLGHFSHNVMAGDAGPKPHIQRTGGFYVESLEALGFRDPENYDFTLTEDSPLIEAGQRLPDDFLIHVKDLEAREGWRQALFAYDLEVIRDATVEGREQFLADIQRNTTGEAPDIGPFEFGREMGPDWPRPRRSVYNAAPLGEAPVLEPFPHLEW